MVNGNSKHSRSLAFSLALVANDFKFYFISYFHEI